MTAAAPTITQTTIGGNGIMTTTPTFLNALAVAPQRVRPEEQSAQKARLCLSFLRIPVLKIDKPDLAWRSRLPLDAFQKPLRQIILDLSIIIIIWILANLWMHIVVARRWRIMALLVICDSQTLIRDSAQDRSVESAPVVLTPQKIQQHPFSAQKEKPSR